MQNPTLYPILAIIGVLITSAVWSRMLAKKEGPDDGRMLFIYLVALAGAFIGAKIVYLASEGWMRLLDPALSTEEKLLDFMTGKTITGAFLGGYLAVEWAKKRVGHTAPTGDYFAAVVPIGLMLGRVGCYSHGCCLGSPMDAAWFTLSDHDGIHRWPAVPAEFTFNLLMLLFAWVCIYKCWFKNQVFHIYLIAYGTFRFSHEFVRATPDILGPISGYHVAALSILILGTIRYAQRVRIQNPA